MNGYAAIYSVRLSLDQFVATGKHPRLGEIVVEDRLGKGYYNLGFPTAELADEFLSWCKENGVRPLLM